MSLKPRKPSEFYKSQKAKKTEVEAKTGAFQLVLPYVEINIGGEKCNYFEVLIKELAKAHEDIFYETGYLNLDLLWEKSESGFAKKGRALTVDGEPLIKVYPTPFQGCKLYQGDIALTQISYWDNDKENGSGGKGAYVQITKDEKPVMNLGGIYDKYDKDGKLVKNNYNAVKIRICSFNILVKDAFGKDLPPPAEGENFVFFDVNARCRADVRDEIAKYNKILDTWNASNPDEQYDKWDCLLVTDELKDPPTNSKSKSPKHSMRIQAIAFM